MARDYLIGEKEFERERNIIIDLEKLLDKYMVSQEEMPDGWVIDTGNEILQRTLRD